MMRVLKPLQDKATTGAGKRLVLPESRRVRFLIRAEGSVSAGAVTIECCPESTKAGKFWMELATIPVPADSGLAQYYTEEASGLFRVRISRPVSNGTVTVTPLGFPWSPRPAGPDKGCMTPARDERQARRTQGITTLWTRPRARAFRSLARQRPMFCCSVVHS